MHGVAAGMPEFSMADLGEQELPVDLMDRFDYTALGHFHNYCQVGKRAWYAGSTERLSQAERDTAKGFLEIDLDPLTVKFHQVHTRCFRQTRRRTGRVDSAEPGKDRQL
jgi:DNA repair exonuclease SbcCD nuclease subunit